MIVVYLGRESSRIIKIIDNLKISYKRIGDDDLEKSLGSCFEKQESMKGRKKFAYICAQSQEEAFCIMRSFKEKGYTKVRISILTETNANWKVQEWMEELDEEYQYFTLRGALQKELEKVVFGNVTFEQLTTYMKAREIFMNNESTSEDYKRILEEIKNMK
ncbi:MAG: DUF3783 domain-containing protein [Bacillota bacterium]|nr:DUF3783 domain-containing protein [Bacillota bacterium]